MVISGAYLPERSGRHGPDERGAGLAAVFGYSRPDVTTASRVFPSQMWPHGGEEGMEGVICDFERKAREEERERRQDHFTCTYI